MITTRCVAQANVLIEDCVFGNGHGASIGSVPDTNGVMGYVTNVTFRASRPFTAPLCAVRLFTIGVQGTWS